MRLLGRNLSCERNGRLVFSGLNFDIAQGQYAEVRGANGAGKSSLLRMLAALVPKAEGEVKLSGELDFSTLTHFIGHQDALKSALTVKENLRFWSALLGGQQIDQALAAFDLASLQNQTVHLLSAGQRRRLALSRLFLVRRPLWLLDEPMTALDKASQDQLRQHLQQHLQDGGIVLATTHGDIRVAADHVITLGVA